MLNKDERDTFIYEISKSGWCYITAFLNGKFSPDHITFLKDLVDNFNIMSFDLVSYECDLALNIAFDNLADWKHFHHFVSNYGLTVVGYRIEETYEI